MINKLYVNQNKIEKRQIEKYLEKRGMNTKDRVQKKDSY